MARATSSLPVPVSPCRSTALSTEATIAISSRTAWNRTLAPIRFPGILGPPGRAQKPVQDTRVRQTRQHSRDVRVLNSFVVEGRERNGPDEVEILSRRRGGGSLA